MFVQFYDEFVDEEVTIDVEDIEEIVMIDGKIIIFNVDALSFQTQNIVFHKEGE